MNHRMNPHSQLDRGRHPALFQRVTRSVPPVSEPLEPRPEFPVASRDIYAACTEFLQLRAAEIHHWEHRTQQSPSAVWEFLESRGFYPEEIPHLKLGLYTTTEDVRSYLRSAGFSETAIAESGLVSDELGTLRHDWHGCLLVPLEEERGRILDVLAVIPTALPGHPIRYEFARGSMRSGLIAYGLKTALAAPAGLKNLVLVEDVLEALYLQCRGFTNVVAVGGDGREFSSKRWEDLARMGVEAVTLAFGNDATRQRDVREALDHALRARTAPEVFVLERTQLLENETLADVARRHGLEACRKAASAKSLAFHGKDFGWSHPREAAASNGHAVPTTFHRENYWAYLRAETDKIPRTHERSVVQGTISEVEQALYHRHFRQARAILEARMGGFGLPVHRPEVRTQDVNTVLDRLCEESARSVIPDYLGRYDGHELQAGTVAILANESVRGRLADLCSRLVTALETRADQTWLVVCREFSEETIVLGLIAHLTRRMTTSQGLTFAEIQARLSGRDPSDGYGDKPWLVDEAVDRLRHWTERLKFFADSAHAPHSIHAIERLADRQTLGGVFFDSMPLAWYAETSRTNGWEQNRSSAAMLRELAQRLSCAVVVVTDHVAEQWQAPAMASRPADWRFPETNPAMAEFREMISHGIEQEERLEIRVA